MKEAKKLGQSILFTTNVSFTSRDEMNDAKKLGHSISESSLVSTKLMHFNTEAESVQ